VAAEKIVGQKSVAEPGMSLAGWAEAAFVAEQAWSVRMAVEEMRQPGQVALVEQRESALEAAEPLLSGGDSARTRLELSLQLVAVKVYQQQRQQSRPVRMPGPPWPAAPAEAACGQPPPAPDFSPPVQPFYELLYPGAVS
jgi:hypothetical protein